MIKTYKKTATVDAMQWNGTNTLAVIAWATMHGVEIVHLPDDNLQEDKLQIPTLEGPMFASVGDFIAKGVNDEFWAIKPDIMEKTYQEV